jgi:DNA-binding NarL/FixJ family response regulator
MDALTWQSQDPWEWWADILEPEGIGGRGNKDLGPTTSRVRNLLTLGWQGSEIAQELGISRQRVHQIKQEMDRR